MGKLFEKNILQPHLKQQWVIAPEASAAFVANMEDVLEVYQRPRDPERPARMSRRNLEAIDCGDARANPRQTGKTRAARLRIERNGVANLFMMFAPLEGWRHVKVTDRHAAVDYAQALKDLSDTHFPDAAKIVLVQDNLSTHTTASLYAAFPAAEARRLVERFEWHYTPSTEAGSTWPIRTRRPLNPVSGSTYSRQADIDKGSRRLGGGTGTNITRGQTGNSQQPTPAFASKGYTLISGDSRH